MPNPLFNIEGLIPELHADSVVLVPNRRLARHISSAWAQYCHQQGQRAWRQPTVQTLDTWLLDCWELLQDRAYPDCLGHSIISPHAERMIWEQAIDDDPDKPVGIEASAFAKLAQGALQNLQRWQVPLTEVANSGHETSQHFLRWHQAFAAMLSNKQLLTAAQAQTFIWQGFQENLLSSEQRVVLVGFNTELPPLYQLILASAFTETLHWRGQKKIPENAALRQL